MEVLASFKARLVDASCYTCLTTINKSCDAMQEKF